MSVYADRDQLVSDYLPEVKKPAELAAIDRILEAASALCDSYTRRRKPDGTLYFLPSPAQPTVRRFRGEGLPYLRLPRHVFGTAGLQDLVGMVVYESDANGWLYIDNPYLNEFNALDETVINGADYFPSGFYPTFWQGKIYLVLARWGYDAIPPEITEAVRLIAARWFETQRGTIGQIAPNGFVIERDLPPAAKTLLKPFIKREFERL